jgi:choline-phosphate cytidylyltransferase
MIIYLDGIFDLFHRGHLESFKQVKTMYPDCHLIVGIVSDKDATDYKREPIIEETNRYEIIKSIKYVDEIIENCPLNLDIEFIKKYKIDLIVHGFSNESDEKKQEVFFKEIKELGMFKKINYYSKTSTTEIIKRIKEFY